MTLLTLRIRIVLGQLYGVTEGLLCFVSEIHVARHNGTVRERIMSGV